MATKVEFKRVETDAEVENIDIKDGQLIYTGTGKTYMDYGTERIPTGSGGGSEVVIDDDQPTGDDWKLWIDSDKQADNTYYNDNGTPTNIKTTTFDTLPVGAEVDYDGSVVPDGWTEVVDPNTYSTDEVRIGTWIDGKPLYRKVVTYTNQSSWGATNTKTTVKVAHGIVNKDIVVRCSMTNSRNQQFPWVDGTENNVTSWTGIVNIDATDINIYIINDSWVSRTWYFTLEYTKTTD